MVAVQQHARTHMCPYRVALYSNIFKAKKHKENKRKTHMPPSQEKSKEKKKTHSNWRLKHGSKCRLSVRPFVSLSFPLAVSVSESARLNPNPQHLELEEQQIQAKYDGFPCQILKVSLKYPQKCTEVMYLNVIFKVSN